MLVEYEIIPWENFSQCFFGWRDEPNKHLNQYLKPQPNIQGVYHEWDHIKKELWQLSETVSNFSIILYFISKYNYQLSSANLTDATQTEAKLKIKSLTHSLIKEFHRLIYWKLKNNSWRDRATKVIRNEIESDKSLDSNLWVYQN